MSAIAAISTAGDWTGGYSLNLPRISYGPFHILEAAPWLFLATVLRIIGFGKPIALLCLPMAMTCIVFALLLAVRRTIEVTGGKSGLEKLSFDEQFRFVARTLKWWFGVMLTLTLLALLIFQYKDASPTFLLSLDGIAFDTLHPATKLVSAAVTIMMFFAVLAAANGHSPDLKSVINGIRYHLPAMAIAYCLLVAFLYLFAYVQADFREIVYGIYGSGPRTISKNWMFMGFVFSFACARLWVSLFILTAVFKWSCNVRARTSGSQVNAQRIEKYSKRNH